MAKYRKKPIVIEAVRFINEYGPRSHWRTFDTPGHPLWLKKAFGNGTIRCEVADEDLERCYYVIKTLEGDMTVSLGDYIICGIQGELYPCKPDIFEQTYESVESVLDPTSSLPHQEADSA